MTSDLLDVVYDAEIAEGLAAFVFSAEISVIARLLVCGDNFRNCNSRLHIILMRVIALRMSMADEVDVVDEILRITPGISIACAEIAEVSRAGAHGFQFLCQVRLAIGIAVIHIGLAEVQGILDLCEAVCDA